MNGMLSIRHEAKPPRKLILRRGSAAADYWSYCEEVGCDVWDELFEVQGAFGEPMGLWLPELLRPPDTSRYVMGVEVPLHYAGSVPTEMELLDLPAHDYLVFQGPPYPEEQMGEAIAQVWREADAYDPAAIGWTWSDTAPRYQLAPKGERGYIEGRPVVQKVS
jgi:AraC family transcriptional regulator